tara:strand:+ start:2331 stop:2522 length:192 start_codon:yes stop_codon:yes gene_type:complete
MAKCPTVEVTDIKTGKTLVINEIDFDSTLHKRGSVAIGTGVKVGIPVPSFSKKKARSRKDNTR